MSYQQAAGAAARARNGSVDGTATDISCEALRAEVMPRTAWMSVCFGEGRTMPGTAASPASRRAAAIPAATSFFLPAVNCTP